MEEEMCKFRKTGKEDDTKEVTFKPTERTQECTRQPEGKRAASGRGTCMQKAQGRERAGCHLGNQIFQYS